MSERAPQVWIIVPDGDTVIEADFAMGGVDLCLDELELREFSVFGPLRLVRALRLRDIEDVALLLDEWREPRPDGREIVVAGTPIGVRPLDRWPPIRGPPRPSPGTMTLAVR